MAIQIGDRIPDVKLKAAGADGIKDVSTGDVLGKGRVVLFALPGAFTPTCSARHLPGFVDKASEFRARGVDQVVCVSVNDAFVMDAWGKDKGAGGKVLLLADGNGAFTDAMGLTLDASGYGMGKRSQRYGAILQDGVVRALEIEAPGKFEVSSAEALLGKL